MKRVVIVRRGGVGVGEEGSDSEKGWSGCG